MLTPERTRRIAYSCDDKNSNFDDSDINLIFNRLVNITIALYGTMSEIIDHGFRFSFKEIGLLVDTVYCSILLFVFCDCSHSATMQVAQGVQDTLLSINMLAVDHPTQREIEIFVQAIEMNPAIVSLRGYAEVNRALLTSVRNFKSR